VWLVCVVVMDLTGIVSIDVLGILDTRELSTSLIED